MQWMFNFSTFTIRKIECLYEENSINNMVDACRVFVCHG